MVMKFAVVGAVGAPPGSFIASENVAQPRSLKTVGPSLTVMTSDGRVPPNVRLGVRARRSSAFTIRNEEPALALQLAAREAASRQQTLPRPGVRADAWRTLFERLSSRSHWPNPSEFEA